MMTRLWILAFFVWIGCDNQDLQEDFEAQAFSTPEGFTRTNQSGEALSVDSDDWRTSPAYQADIEITPAFPNPPTAGDLITVPVRIRGTNTVRGSLNLVFFDSDRLSRRLDDIRSARDPGAYVFRFNPALIGRTGLVRVFILDSLGDLVSYGDIMFEE